MVHGMPWEETSQGRIRTRTPHFFSSPFKAGVLTSLHWLILMSISLPVYVYSQFWSCHLPICCLAGTIAPMSRSSKYNRSHKRAEKACDAFQSIISILQVRTERDRWRKPSCFQPNVLFTTALSISRWVYCEGSQQGQVDVSPAFML